MHCNNGLNNKLVETLVENKVAEETGDLKYLQNSMYDFVKTLKEIILGEYSPEFFNKYVDEALKLHGSNLEEFLKIPKMGLELRQALNSIDEAIDISNQEFKDNLVSLLDKFQTTLDNMEYEARSPYEIAVKHGFKGTEEEWLANILSDTKLLNNLKSAANNLAGYIDTIPNIVNDAINNTAVEGGVLADTFVTVTSFNGSEARTQRDVNQELLESSRLLQASEYLFKPSTATDHTQELNDTLDYCFNNNLRAKPVGEFNINNKVVIKGAFDGSRATFITKTAIPIALEISTGIGENPTTVVRLTNEETLILPNVINGTKPATGWLGQGIGVRYVNVQNTKITERLVENFGIGIQHTAYSVGCGYNTVQAGYLRNNKINRQFVTGNDTGWVNRWDFFGGRYFHSSLEGIETEGVIHFDVVPNATGLIINDINHWGGSFEGMVQQYHLRLGGAYISFFGIRLETAAQHGGVKVHLAAAGLINQGAHNGIYYGRGVSGQAINVTTDSLAGIPAFTVRSSQGTEVFIGSGTLTSYQTRTSSTQPALNFFDANVSLDANRDTEWSLGVAAHKIMGKRRADTVSRIEFDTQNGRLYFGDGVTAPTTYLQNRADGIGLAGNFYPYQTEMYDSGSSAIKWRNVYAAKYMFTATVGAFYGTGTPEGVVAAGVGSTYHRTDGAAGTCFYVKETGTGKTGWVAK